jgi:hypothetical protein
MFDKEGEIENIQSEDIVKKNFLAENKSFIFIGLLALLIVSGITWFVINYINNHQKKTPLKPKIENTITATTTNLATLPTDESTSTVNILDSISLEMLEKYNFSDFYQEPEPIPTFSFKDYSLPVNVKIDVLNYYDVSRKISLDSGVSDLNVNGFAIFDNPDYKKVTDFYSAYSWLLAKEIPIAITSDFLLHWHQNNVKQVFKDIEENIFYDNLWRVSKILYDTSKERYETHLAKVGNINDQTLEGERLATAYFAVVLKLLEPDENQIDKDSKDKGKFSKDEAEKFSFTLLPYLQSDAGVEIDFIKAAKENKKSPVLLYNRNYSDFVVPAEYQKSAKLYNFYLASTWLNSVFPLVVRDKNCPDCLLDKEDARLSLIAATFITKDFSANQELKNDWALIYKLLSYSKGLRSDLTYLHYDEVMKKLFGDNYDPELVFAEDSPDALKNIDLVRSNLLAIDFDKSQGALDKKTEKPRLGFKLLADYYLPNDYIFNSLSGESVGEFQAEEASTTNKTICRKSKQRCNGFALDVIAIISDKVNLSSFWTENTNFANYVSKLDKLKTEIKNFSFWHGNNFWSTLGAAKNLFENNNGQMQAYASTDSWQKRLLESAVATWVDLQLPLESLSLVSAPVKSGLTSEVSFNENFYIEPNYYLINRLIADNEMIYGMLKVMGVNNRVPSVDNRLKEENVNLRKILELVKKELSGEALDYNERDFLNNFAKQYQLLEIPSNRLYIKTAEGRLYEDLGIRLMAIVYELNEGKYIAVGPIFSHQERR